MIKSSLAEEKVICHAICLDVLEALWSEGCFERFDVGSTVIK